MARLLSLLAVLLALPACGDVIVDPPPACTPGVDCPGDPELINGVNVDRLLGLVTSTEATAARAEWPGATPTYQAELRLLRTDPDGTRLYVLSADRPVETHALVRVPGPAGANTPLPVVLVLPRSAAATEADFLTQAADEPLASRWVQVMPTYRGGTLRVEGGAGETFSSPQPPSPYLGDVTDALGLLGVALGRAPRTDPSRVGAVGFGRGGGVALLAAMRTGSPLRAVGTLAAPSDLFVETTAIRDALRGDPLRTALPGFAAVADTALAPLLTETLGIEGARARLIARSPRYHVGLLPPTVALHGRSDGIVVFEHGRRLGGALGQEGGSAFVTTEDDHTGLFGNAAARTTLATHLENTIAGAAPAP